MIMRAFTQPEERALTKLQEAPGATRLDITRDRPWIYQRLADHGLVSITSIHRQKRARLTGTGRYFAKLIAARGVSDGA